MELVSSNEVPIENDAFCEAEIVNDGYEYIEPGKYDLVYLHHETVFMFKKAAKLVIWFRVVTQGKYFGIKVPRFYNVNRIIGKPQKNGGFKVGRRSDFFHEYDRLFHAPDRRLDRIPVHGRFSKVIIVGRIDVVKQNYKQRDVSEASRYSVVRELIEVKQL